MSNRSRDYGLDWERELVNLFKNLDVDCIRTPNSGAFGTQKGIAKLQGDVLFKVDGKPFLIEAKAGYGGHKSMTLKRKWIDKTIEEAENQQPKRTPLLALKFKYGRGKSSKVIMLTVEDFYSLLEDYKNKVDKLSDAYDFIYSLKDEVDISEFMDA